MSWIDTARPRRSADLGARVRILDASSASAPPAAATGLSARLSPFTGLASWAIDVAGGVALPAPKRYDATTLPAPVGRRAPLTPSPNVTTLVLSSFWRTMYTGAVAGWPKNVGTSVQRRPSTHTVSVLATPASLSAVGDAMYVSGFLARANDWSATAPSPLPSTSAATVSPRVAATTLP